MRDIKNKDIEYFLELLNDYQIINKILNIVNGNKNTDYSSNESKSVLMTQYEKLKNKLNDLTIENQNLIKELENSKNLEDNNQNILLKNNDLKLSLENLTKEYKILLDEKEKYQENFEKIISEKSMLENDIDYYKSKLQAFSSLAEENNLLKKNLNIIEQENKNLKESILEGVEIYNIYNSIQGVSKKELEEIFRENSLESFLFCGSQVRNIEILWEIAKKSILTDNEDSSKIAMIFYYFFDRINKTYERPIYEYLNSKVGETFNSFSHFSVGKASGEIKNILLKGYQDRNGKIIKKSIVIL